MKNKILYVFFVVTALMCCFAFSAFAGFDMDADDILELEQVENYYECYAVGDIDGNGAIKADDARFILRAAVNLENIDASAFIKADIDGDGKITAKDARTALRLAVGLDKIPDHDIEEIVIAPSTCATDGLTVKLCKTCLKIYAKVTVPAKENGHITNGRWTIVKAPNCMEDGVGQLKCILCEQVVKEEPVKKLTTHSGEWEYPDGKDCYNPYVAKRTCDVCGEKEAKKINPPGECGLHNVLSKNYEFKILKKATCTEDGEGVIACKHCEKTKEPEVIKATGHLFEREVLTPSTCTKQGSVADICVNCGETENELLLPLKEHSFDNIHYKVTEEPSCSKEGKADVFCIECSLSDTITLPKTEHTLIGEWSVTKNPSCTEKGEAAGICEYCDDVTKEIEATGHTVANWVNTKPASCTEEGLKTGYCSVCGDEAAEEKIEKIPHKFDKSHVYYNPETEVPCKGVWDSYFKCLVCGEHSDIIEQPQQKCSNAHYQQTRVVNEASCTERKTTVKVCDYCKEDIKGTEVKTGKALGHNFSTKWEETKPVSCTEDGARERSCSRCDEKQTEIITKTGHIHGTPVRVSEATCTQGEKTEIYCTVCSALCEIRTGDPLPHKEVKKLIADSASVTEEGNFIVKCTISCEVCSTVIEEEATVTRIELRADDGIEVAFSEESGINPGDEIVFSVSGAENIIASIHFGNEGENNFLEEENDEYRFTIPTDLGDAETIKIIIQKLN